eukprot:1092180-Amphidinium_carterae.1
MDRNNHQKSFKSAATRNNQKDWPCRNVAPHEGLTRIVATRCALLEQCWSSTMLALGHSILIKVKAVSASVPRSVAIKFCAHQQLNLSAGIRVGMALVCKRKEGPHPCSRKPGADAAAHSRRDRGTPDQPALRLHGMLGLLGKILQGYGVLPREDPAVVRVRLWWIHAGQVQSEAC